HVYPASHEHGNDILAGLQSRPVSAAAIFTHDPRLSSLTLRDALFLDTETTGLAGAGTLAFMVGLAFWEGDALIVRQTFCRDYDDEPAMLWLVAQQAATKAAVVSFNGRSFDLPLLNGRYLLNRLDDVGDALFSLPHLDLLPPSRRLWRSRLISCSLHSLEEKLLGVTRGEIEVPGWAIPAIYHDYLHDGDGREIARVFYHNRMDMLSMVTLIGRLLRQFEQPQAWDDPLDLLSLAKWQVELEMLDEAEQVLRQVANPQHPLGPYQEALTWLGQLYKHSGRRTEAIQCWQQIAVTSLDNVSAHVELAKHYEWREVDLGRALEWTDRALRLLDHRHPVSPGSPAASQRAELEHRLARLRKKASGGD
ncbi:MAG: ribonuclease H-like domain-containing protein, partial [Chloroflexota bacterium]